MPLVTQPVGVMPTYDPELTMSVSKPGLAIRLPAVLPMLAVPVSPATVSLNPASSSAPENWGSLPSPRQSQSAVSVAFSMNSTPLQATGVSAGICTANFPENTREVFSPGRPPATVLPSASVHDQLAGFDASPSPPAFVQNALAAGRRKVPLPAFV